MSEQIPGITEPRRVARRRAKAEASDPGFRASRPTFVSESSGARTITETSRTISETSRTIGGAPKTGRRSPATVDSAQVSSSTLPSPAGVEGMHDDAPRRRSGLSAAALAVFFVLGGGGLVASLAMADGGLTLPEISLPGSGGTTSALDEDWDIEPFTHQLPDGSPGFEDLPRFEPVHLSGTGPATIDAPAPVGLATIRYSGGFLSVWALDADGESVGVLTSGAVGGGVDNASWGVADHFFGLHDEIVTAIEIRAEGDWEIVLQPLTGALPLPASGEGPGTFRVDGPLRLTLTREDPEGWDLLDVFGGNAWSATDLPSGEESATVEHPGDGPAVVVITTRGRWTTTQR